ncbi:MAG TPA: ABC transporter permease [Thermomicrobiales bacterium]|nr:ABC transporter permease [Thermomicrobiales bacterium]
MSTVPVAASGTSGIAVPRTRQNQLLRSLKRDPWASASLLFLLAVVLAAILSPVLVPDTINSPSFGSRLLPPLTDGHIAGTDQLGRDVWGRMLLGARISMTVGFLTVVLSALIGVPIGMLAGYYGGWLDVLLMRLVDVQLAFPFILLALTINAILGLGLRNIIITLVIAGWIEYARIARGETLVVREREFVQAAHLTGARSGRIFLRHILPNIITPLIVISTLQVARFIIAEASISFLGFGVQPPTPAWGSMVSEGLDYIFSAWWLITLPGLALALVALAVNITGDWLRDTLDPRIRT